MTAGVVKTSFASEIKWSATGSRHGNIIQIYQDRSEHQLVDRSMYVFKQQGGGLRTNRKDPVKTAGRTTCVKGQEVDGP